MNDELVRTIQEALKIEKWPHGDSAYHHGVVTRHETILNAIKAIAEDCGCTDQQVIWRAIRLYLFAYLNTANADIG